MLSTVRLLLMSDDTILYCKEDEHQTLQEDLYR